MSSFTSYHMPNGIGNGGLGATMQVGKVSGLLLI